MANLDLLRLNARQKADFSKIAKMPPSDFEKFVGKLLQSPFTSVRPSVLVQEVQGITKDEEFTNALCAQLLSLASFRRDERLSSSEVVSALLNGAKEMTDAPEIAAWLTESDRHVERLLDSAAIVVPAKARSLSADFDRAYASGKVVTDVRPVFSDDRKSVLGAVVLHTLCIKYYEPSRVEPEGQIRMALDSEDLRKLIGELEDGLRKAEIAKVSMGASLEDNVYIIGEE